MPVDLSLYTGFGVMPVTGHWHLRHRSEARRAALARLVDSGESHASMRLTVERAVAEWKRLEPPAIGHERPLLHEFFGRTRSCLAHMDEESSEAVALCWVPALRSARPWEPPPETSYQWCWRRSTEVAKAKRPETLGVFCTTDSWWLLDRLRRLPGSTSTGRAG